MLDTRQDRPQRRRVTPRPVCDDALWCTAYPSDGTYEETPCRISVTPLAEVDVYDLAMLVDRTIAVGPSAVEAAIRLIHVPLPAYRPSVRASSLREQWQEALDPAVDGAPVDHDAAFGKPLGDICVT
jgi:hypothetical protein